MIKKFVCSMLAAFAVAAFGAVDVNTGNQAALESIKGVGPALSSRIIAEREKSAFKNWADVVDRVKGLGEGYAAKLSDSWFNCRRCGV
jgi:competence protein ComEA